MKVQLSKANISACQGTLKAHKERFLSPERAPAFERHWRARLPLSRALQRRAAERSYPHLGGALLRSVRVVPFRVGSAIRAGSCLAAEISLLRSDLSTELGRLCDVGTM